MLGRARDRAKSASASANTSTSKSDLAKQLFPSSSPSRQECDIQSWVTSKEPHSAAMSSTAHTNGPLTLGSGSLRPPLNKRDVSTASNTSGVMNSLVSVCSNAGSFEDRPPLSKSQSLGNTMNSVFMSEEDFSDDDTLELDYECPPSLPPSQLVSNPLYGSSIQPPRTVSATPTSVPPSKSQIAWSSSVQHHILPTITTQKLKRSPPNAVQETAKKRLMSSLAAQSEAVRELEQIPTQKSGPLWDSKQSAGQEKGNELNGIYKLTDDHPLPKKAITLSTEQSHVVQLVVKDRKSVFFTGPAGTGKSVLMESIIAELKKIRARNPESLSVTASTGLAACNIGGQTLHSFAGIGLGKEDVPTLVRKIRRNPKAKDRWLKTKTLIIDEISMVDADLFDKLAQIARTIRNNGRPFGGIQLVITGDFFQLPPVPEGGKAAKFAFDAATWNTSIDHTIGLTQIFRQRDPQFAGMLNEMRLGKISEDTVKTFKALARPLTFDDGLEVTELFSTRIEVERSNDSRLRNLPGEVHHFEAIDTGEPTIRDKLLVNMMAPKSISLKKDAQVMLIKNMDDTLVNGSLGKVIGFMSEATFIDCARNDDKSAPAPKGSVDPREYPVVRFTSSDRTHRTVLCVPEDWKSELPTGEIQAARRQVPLILAWALSIHKAQGQTLERVKVDLGKAFERGQAYVALSRAVTKQGLQVLRFEKNKVMAHPRVIHFYNNLYSAESAMQTNQTRSISEFRA